MKTNEVVNKTILITGGTSGVGLELVRILSEKNQVIFIGKRDLGSFSKPQNVDYVKMDLSDVHEIASLYEQKISHKSIDILINNAAVQNQVEMINLDYGVPDIIHEINTNFTSCCVLTKLFLQQSKDVKRDIININSGLALVPKKTSAVYCGTKAALSAFTFSLRYQMKECGWGVYQAFLPLVDTKLSKSSKKQRAKISPEEAARKIIDGFQRGIKDHYVGEVKLLRLVHAVLPKLAQKIMSRI